MRAPNYSVTNSFRKLYGVARFEQGECLVVCPYAQNCNYGCIALRSGARSEEIISLRAGMYNTSAPLDSTL
jgi:hypothetical protein